MEPTEPTGATPSSEFRIDGALRDAYEKSLLAHQDADEIEMRRAITVWARKITGPATGTVIKDWIYAWN
jgi:hypothetical protein